MTSNTFAALSAAALYCSGIACAIPILHVNDSNGILGTVDAADGSVSIIGDMGVVMTDIAFDGNGNLFGLSFTGFYSIDAATGVSTLIGAHGVLGANALVFGENGTLYAAGVGDTNLYTIDPSTGSSTNLGDMGFASGGDLAFVGSQLYLADVSSTLVAVDLMNLGSSFAVGSFGAANVFGIASTGMGDLFGVAGTSIFSVNTMTGLAISAIDYSGQGLSNAFGQSFFTESGAEIPLPAGALLMGSAIAGFLGTRKKKPA